MASEDNEIIRHRGDTKPIMFQLWEDKANDLPLDITGYSFKFTVDISERPVDESNNLFQLVGQIVGDPSLGKVMFSPTAINTDLSPRSYYYDLEIVDSAGYIETPMVAKFKIYQDITK